MLRVKTDAFFSFTAKLVLPFHPFLQRLPFHPLRPITHYSRSISVEDHEGLAMGRRGTNFESRRHGQRAWLDQPPPGGLLPSSCVQSCSGSGTGAQHRCLERKLLPVAADEDEGRRRAPGTGGSRAARAAPACTGTHGARLGWHATARTTAPAHAHARASQASHARPTRTGRRSVQSPRRFLLGCNLESEPLMRCGCRRRTPPPPPPPVLRRASHTRAQPATWGLRP